MSFWSQTMEIARVDMSLERRTGDVIRIVVPFAVIALLVFPLALGVDLSGISRIGPAVFWALGVLFGMQVALRQTASDSPERRDLYALLGVVVIRISEFSCGMNREISPLRQRV